MFFNPRSPVKKKKNNAINTFLVSFVFNNQKNDQIFFMNMSVFNVVDYNLLIHREEHLKRSTYLVFAIGYE